MTGKLVPGPALKSGLSSPSLEAEPLVNSEHDGVYHCGDPYSTIANVAGGLAIGNCPSNEEFDVEDYGYGGEKSGYFYGGYFANLGACAWAKVSEVLNKEKSGNTGHCSGGIGYEYGTFYKEINSNTVPDGFYVVNRVACEEYANVRPWGNDTAVGPIRSVPAYTEKPGTGYPALKWRYVTNNGKYVMVRDARISGGEGNWVFVERSCLPATLPGADELLPPKPTATTDGASGIATSYATLNATVNPNGVATSYTFDWGTTTSYGKETPLGEAGLGTSNIAVKATISGLTPGTTYYFRIVASSAIGESVGGPVPFTTVAEPPEVSTEAASNIEAPDATLHGTVNPKEVATTYYFQYGTTTNWNESSTTPTEAGSGNSPVNESISVANLLPYTTYYDRIVATNAGGTSPGGAESFKTGAPANGSIWRVSNGANAGEISTAAGGALITDTECAGEVSCSGYVEIPSEFAASYRTAHPTIANGTLVRVADGPDKNALLTAAGGATIGIGECAGEVNCTGWVNIDEKGLKRYEEAHPTIANGTLVRVADGPDKNALLTAAGGATIGIGECAGEVNCTGWVNIDEKGLKRYEEAHPTIANGTLVRVADGPDKNALLTAAGGATIGIGECAGEVNCTGWVNIDEKGLKRYEEAHPTIANGTLVRVADGPDKNALLTAAGGATIGIGECAGEVNCTGWVNIDEKGLKRYEEAHPTIANGTLVRVANGKNAGEISIAAGGALLKINECTLLNGCAGYVNVDSKGLKNDEEAHPTIANGTYLLGLPSKKTWIIESGKREEAKANEASVTVTDVMLEKIPIG